MITRKSRDEIKRMRHAGHIVALVHKKMKEVIEPGISTKELDSIAMQVIKENKAIPTFLGYHGFPGCICASINDLSPLFTNSFPLAINFSKDKNFPLSSSKSIPT